MYTAQPNLNNMINAKQFATREEAVAHLEVMTGFDMSFEVSKSMKKLLLAEGYSPKEANELAKTYDWELIGKLYKTP